jgi:TolA-binding protein
MKYILLLILLIAGCEKKAHINQVLLKSNIEIISRQLQSQKELDLVLANRFQDSVKIYMAAFPEDTTTPKFLFTSAQVYRALQQPEKAIATFDMICKKYNNFPLAPEAKFLAAFTSEVDMKNMTIANKKYQEFIKEYPNNPLAEQAKISLENINKALKN